MQRAKLKLELFALARNRKAHRAAKKRIALQESALRIIKKKRIARYR